MPGVLPMDNPGRFGPWSQGAIDDPAISGQTTPSPAPSYTSAPTSGTNTSAIVGGGDTVPQGGGYSGGYGNVTDGGRMAPLPSETAGGNGGSYGVGGRGPGGWTGVTTGDGGVMSLDNGGVIPDDDGDEDDQQSPDGNASTIDPMSVIQNALGWGRQQMGLPKDFFGAQPQPDQDDQQQGFDDGGVIPEQPQQEQQPQGNGAQLPDPRKTMAYLAGAGNIPPDAAQALEQRVDPQGQMDPAERKMSAVAAAGSPQAQFGLLQHYRTLFNAHSAAAQAMLDKGNLAQAAQHATEAMSNVPNGNSVRFAPAKGGLAMHSKPIGQQQQQGFGEGGAVDTDNPSVMMKSYDGGGNVFGGNTFGGNTFGGNTFGGATYGAGPVIPPDEGEDVGEETGGGQEDADTNDDTGSPVIPNDVPGDPVSDVTPSPRAEPAGATPTPTGPVDLAGQVTPLSLDDVKKLFQGGWDKLTEGWDGAKDILAQTQKVGPAVNRMLGGPGEQPEDIQAAAAQANGSSGAPGGAQAAPRSNGTQGQIPTYPQGHVGTAEEFNKYIPQAIKTQQDFNRQRYGTDNAGNKLPPQGAGSAENVKIVRPEGWDKPDPLRDLTNQARSIFGNVRTPQAQQYITRGMEAAQKGASTLENTKAAYGDQGKLGIAREQIAGRAANSANAIQGRLQAAVLGASSRGEIAEMNNFTRLVGQQLASNPDAASDPEKLQKLIAPYVAQGQAKFGIQPRDLLNAVMGAQQGGQQQGAQSPGADLQSNQTVVKNKADYDALAPGTSFVDTNGKRWTKK